jgi:hypothetical protein
MRCLGLWVALAAAASSVGCESKKASGGTQADMARVEALQKEESDVLARRTELEREKQAVRDARAALELKKKAGGDPKVLEAEEKALVEREAKLAQDQSQNDQDVQKLLDMYKSMSSSFDVTQAMAVREKDVARREEIIAKREGDIASRERDLAKRERETCSAVPTTIVQAAPLPAGSKYSKRDVEGILAKARKKMNEKGILSSDLPPGAANLEKEATESMGDGEYGRAKLAADALFSTVDQLKIDKSFIMAKINRLSAQMKAKTTSKEIEELFRGATGDYGDGKFVASNVKLNRIWALIR